MKHPSFVHSLIQYIIQLNVLINAIFTENNPRQKRQRTKFFERE